MKKIENITPSFFVVGAQKAGTTTLHDILIQHPNIYLPIQKETKFFADDYLYKKGLEFYFKEYFSNYSKGNIIGEIDPEYMYFDFVPERIYNNFGKDLKFIFILRNPADRAFSHYKMSLKRGYEELSFSEALLAEPQRINSNSQYSRLYLNSKHKFSYIDRGFYSKQINQYLKYFPKENMHFIIFETELIGQIEKTMGDIYNFLGISPSKNVRSNIKSNSSTKPKSLWIRDLLMNKNIFKSLLKRIFPKEIRKKIKNNIMNFNLKADNQKLDNHLREKIITNYYLKEIKQLEVLINKDLSFWIKGDR